MPRLDRFDVVFCSDKTGIEFASCAALVTTGSSTKTLSVFILSLIFSVAVVGCNTSRWVCEFLRINRWKQTIKMRKSSKKEKHFINSYLEIRILTANSVNDWAGKSTSYKHIKKIRIQRLNIYRKRWRKMRWTRRLAASHPASILTSLLSKWRHWTRSTTRHWRRQVCL